MKLNINKYLDIFYSVMNDNNIYSTSILDMVEIVKIIFSSEDFKLLSSRLDVNEFTEDNVLNHRYTIDFDENGVVSFEVPEEKRTKIINDNMVDAGYIQMAINKRALVKQISVKSNGVFEFKYDGPDTVYEMPLIHSGDYDLDSALFTDGKLSDNHFYKRSEIGTNTRVIRVSNATFSIILFTSNGLINKGELRGLYYGDYDVLLEQAKKIMNKSTESFDEVVKESPKVYRFKKH